MFLDLLGFTAILVDFQFRAERMQAPGWMIGAILASSFIVQTLVSPAWGRASDKWGRKPVFLICCLFSAGSMVVYALAPSLIFLLLSRIFSGIGAANTAVAQAVVTDSWSGEERTAALGRLSAAQTLGMVLGPAAGGFAMHQLGSTTASLIAASLSFLGCLLAFFWGDFKSGQLEVTERKYGFLSLVKEFPSVLPLFLGAVTAWFSLAMLEGTFGRLIGRTLGLGEREFGLIFAFESVVWVGVSAFLLTPILKLGKEKRTLSFSYILMGIGLALFPFAPSLLLLFGCSFLYALGQGFASPAVNALCSKEAGEDRQGELFGLLQGARSIGFVLGPILGGALFDLYHPGPYLVAGLACAAAALVVQIPVRKAAA
jgi:MFS family permease